MYLRILKKDLKRKKTMNIILFVFIILAATFIASSVNNMLSVTTALDSYFEKAGVPDYWFVVSDKSEIDRFESFAAEEDYDYTLSKMMQVMPSDVYVEDRKLDMSTTVCLGSFDNSINVFDSKDDQLTGINNGEIYMSADIFYSSNNDINVGDEIKIKVGEQTKTFTLKGYVKDALFGSSMLGISKMMINENDYKSITNEDSSLYFSAQIYTDDPDYMQKFLDVGINSMFSINRSGIKMMYIMDMLIAGIMLIVSICLILISMVILRFTINFTMSEEFREIGVMKALGIRCSKIRGLYIVKYLGISVVGSVIGFALSIPFGKMMLKSSSQNIVISNQSGILINIICAIATALIVVLFCYFCTRKINKFSPIDAIRNGQSGERFSRKSILNLSKTKFSPVPFMAVNDILSGIKRFIAMILIFALGLLLIILPTNTINTLQSDNIIDLFNMTVCDHVIAKELLLTNVKTRANIENELDEVKDFLAENNIQAKVSQQVMLRMTVTHDGKKAISPAFQGVGDVRADEMKYLEGTAPQKNNEVALAVAISENIDAHIGDEVEIINGEGTKKYIVTAIYQSMNNLGEGIRFYNEESLDYSQLAGTMGIQIRYTDNPDKQQISERKELLEKHYEDARIQTISEYTNEMIGDVAGQLGAIKQLILVVVLCINILVTVLMVKSFITKERGEIAMLKAIGFKNSSLVAWQSLRIGIVLIISTILAILLSKPLSQLIITPLFKMMGAVSIDYEIVPLEVYVLYPLIVLCVTVLSATISAQQVRGIKSSETSNIE